MQLYICNGRATNYYITTTGECINAITNKPLKGQVNRHGYKSYMLSIDGDKIRKYAHRMVAETYIPNPNELQTVNHVDGNKLNNVVENLEWASYSGQARHAIALGLRNTKPIYCFNDRKELIAEYKNVAAVVELLHYNPNSLRLACEQEVKTLYHGFFWNYEPCIKSTCENTNTGSAKPVGQYDANGKLIQKYISIADAARKNGYTRTRISECCSGKQRTYKGYSWKYI